MNSVFENDKQYIANTYSRFPVCFVSGKGALLYDSDGKEYIDMGSGIAVNSFGVADDEWLAAVTAQAAKLQHTSNLYFSEPCVKLAELLCEKTGMKKVFFSNSGAEANECAIKAARKYAFMKYGDESHSTVITLKNSFHGRTVTTLSATGQDAFHTQFGPFTEGFVYADTQDSAQLKRLAAENSCCAVMVEVVQGEGGVSELSREFTEALTQTAEENDLLIIVDEVQTGNGRTGELYGYMNYSLKPDIVTTAKGLGGGLPLGATLFSEKTADVMTPGSHGSTFGGNPVCCAGAVSILSRIDDAFLLSVREKAQYIRTELQGAKGVLGVSGLGLMMGIETKGDAKELANRCLEAGVVVLTAKTKIRLLPPLNIEWEQIKKAVRIIKGVLAGTEE